MFVAYNMASKTFVVAVAATNPLSAYDLLGEDASVNPITSWPYGQTLPSGGSFPAAVAIAPGTIAGVNILQAMKDSTNQSLWKFLITQGQLDPSQWAQVYVYPTAGPTPGNEGFSALFAGLFPQTTAGEQPWQVWNSLLWNSLDIVPHAWNSTLMNEIATLYGSTAPAGEYVSKSLTKAIARAQNQGYEQLPNGGSLEGAVVSLSDLPPAQFKLPDGIDPASKAFLQEAAYQHGPAYFSLFDVLPMLSRLRSLKPPRV